MSFEIKLPALSENLSEGGVLELRVKSGDAVKAGDIVAVIEAEKSTVEVPSDQSGTITEVQVKKGDRVKVGQALLRGEAGAGKPRAAPAKAEKEPKGEAPVVKAEKDTAKTAPAAKVRDADTGPSAAEHERKAAAAVAGKPPAVAANGPARNGEHDGGP